MSDTASTCLMTVEDLYRLPDDPVHHELVRGTLISEPPPGGNHGQIAATITGLLTSYNNAHRQGVVLTCDTLFVLARGPDTVRGPDVAYITRERYLALENRELAIPGAPDLAVEVLSPGNREAGIHAKVGDYLAAGTTLVWVVDSRQEQIKAYRHLLEPTVLAGPDVLTAADLLPGFSATVSEVFEF